MIWGILLVVFRAGLHFRMVSSTIRANILHFVPKPLQFSGKIGILLVIPMKWELIAMRKGTIRLAGTAPLFWESNLEVKKLHTTPERSLPRNW